MKIASCILILTFAVYLDSIGCSPQGAGSSNVRASPASHQAWELLKIKGYPIQVKRDPETGKLFDIRIRGQMDYRKLLKTDTQMVHVIDENHSLKFLAFVNRADDRWLAVTLFTPTQRRYLTFLGAPTLIIAKRRSSLRNK